MTSRRTDFPQSLVAEMHELYKQGATLSDLAMRFGASRTHIWRQLTNAGFELRPLGSSPVKYPLEDMYRMYQQGHSLQEVGESVGIVGERVRQLFKSIGLQTRSASNRSALKAKAYQRRTAEIVDAFRRCKDPAIVASELGIPKTRAIKILREQFSTHEYREITRKPPKYKKKYSQEELIAFLREASTQLGSTFRGRDYDKFARRQRTTDGRPWALHQTHSLRFGSWQEALAKAGLSTNPPSTPRRKKVKFDKQQCIKAVYGLQQILGRAPNATEYDHHARASSGALPSISTVKIRCGSWAEVLHAVAQDLEGG